MPVCWLLRLHQPTANAQMSLVCPGDVHLVVVSWGSDVPGAPRKRARAWAAMPICADGVLTARRSGRLAREPACGLRAASLILVNVPSDACALHAPGVARQSRNREPRA